MSVYLYKPPTWRNVTHLGGALYCGVPTSTVVFRMDGVWYNQQTAGMDAPVIGDIDVDADSGLTLFFTKPMVVPGSIHDELAALEPADPSWTPGELILL